MKTLIGDKKSFAIEYQVNTIRPYMMGYACLWIDNLPFGNFEEEGMLSTFQHGLACMVSYIDKMESSKLKEAMEKNMDLFEVVCGLDDNEHYIFSLDETTDSFVAFIFKDGQNLKIFWRLYEPRASEFPNYPKGPFLKSVPVETFIKVVKEAGAYLSTFK